jgi:hypothetical protein
MASSTQPKPGAGHGITASDPSSSSQPQSTIPIEMSDLEASKRTAGAGSQRLLNDVSIPTTSPLNSTFPSTLNTMSETNNENTRPEQSSNAAISGSAQSTDPLSSSSNDPIVSTSTASGPGPGQASSSAAPPAQPSMSRLDSIAIGPSTDTPPTPVISEAGPILVITLLLTSGARHPYKIDEKYLTKRNVSVPGVTENGRKDPYSISVYTLKELILREWREEWEAKPSSPSSIRLIYFGRLLDDKTPLKGLLSLLSRIISPD